jgi:CheY-like chemotaxis protein
MAQLAKGTVVRNGLVTWSGSSKRRRDNRPSTPHNPTLLWIDDFVPALAVYKATMESFGFKVLTASSGEAGVKLAASKAVDLVVTDYEMPGMNGETVAAAVKSMKPAVPVIMFSGSTTISQRSRRCADAFCDKAGSRRVLLSAIHRLLHKKRNAALQPLPPLEASHHERRTVA